MKENREFECPTCHTKLELTSKRSLIVKIPWDKPEGKPRSQSAILSRQAGIILEILSDAEPNGLYMIDLKRMAEEKCIHGNDLANALTLLYNSAEIWRNDFDKWKVLRK
jgi:transcription initiation factor IIE alpha subunit